MQAGPALQSLTVVFVGTVIGDRRIELVQKIPVGTVDLHGVKARFLCPESRFDEAVLYTADILCRHRFLLNLAVPHGDAAGTERRQSGILCLAAGVIDLGRDHGPLPVHRVRQFPVSRDQRILCHGQLSVMRHPFRRDILMLHDDHGRPSCAGGIIRNQRVVRCAVVRFSRGHGRHHQAVAKFQMVDDDLIF